MDLRSSSYEREGVLLVMKKMYLTITLTSTRIRQRVLSGHAIKICLDMAVPDTSIWTLCFLHVEYGRRAAKKGSVEVLVE